MRDYSKITWDDLKDFEIIKSNKPTPRGTKHIADICDGEYIIGQMYMGKNYGRALSMNELDTLSYNIIWIDWRDKDGGSGQLSRETNLLEKMMDIAVIADEPYSTKGYFGKRLY